MQHQLGLFLLVVLLFKEAKVSNVAVAFSGIFANVNKD
jgi:hypothetical protein